MSDIMEKIATIELEMSRTQKNKATAAHLGSLKAKLAKLEPGEDVLTDAAHLCLAVGADGLRGELTLMRAARALAALKGAKSVKREHMIAVAPSALRHRLRRDVLDETGSTVRITRAIAELFG